MVTNRWVGMFRSLMLCGNLARFFMTSIAFRLFCLFFQTKMEGSRGLSISYDPPGPDAPTVIHPNEFPVNTQEICYINVSRLEMFHCARELDEREISWLFQATSSCNSKRGRRN